MGKPRIRERFRNFRREVFTYSTKPYPYRSLACLVNSVGDPDPHVFGPPGSFPFPINVLSGLKNA
jgi:hypothetical protein